VRDGQWGMPGHTEARKGAVSGDTPGGAAHTRGAPDARMGKPGQRQRWSSVSRQRRTRGTETSQYPEEEKSSEMPGVAASERGGAQTWVLVAQGLEAPRTDHAKRRELPWNGGPETVRAR